MGDDPNGVIVDVLAFDRRVARATASVTSSLKGVAAASDSDGLAVHRRFDPFQAELRDVSTQSTFRALSASTSIVEDHKRALMRWVHEHLQTRIAWDLTIEEREAETKIDPTVQRSESAAKKADADILATWGAAHHAFAHSTDDRSTRTSLDRLAALAPPIAAVRKERRARRFEAARRLGLDHPWSLAVENLGKAHALANAILAATEPLAIELHKKNTDPRHITPVTYWIGEAFGRQAREGWPAHLNARWFDETFQSIVLRPTPLSRELPAATGGASFARAALAWGASLRENSVVRTTPFALSRDPYPTEAHLHGSVLALALGERAFAKRKLGLVARSADAHARLMGRSLFATLRFFAANFKNGMTESLSRDDSEELTTRIFGAPLPEALASAWSYGCGFSGAARIDAPSRLYGAVRAFELAKMLVDRYDEDWFDNPRAGKQLDAMRTGPIWSPDAPDEATSPRALASHFEELLG